MNPGGVACAVLLAVVTGVAALSSAAGAVSSPPAQVGIVIERDVAYPTADTGSSTLDAYAVSGAHGAPALVLVHGGGWQSGDKSSMAAIATVFAQAGFASFSVDYRLAPAAPYPAATTDVATAVRWLRQPAQVAHYGIDPARIGIFGVSAGGNLAAWVGASGSGALDEGARVRAVASWSGPMALVKYAVHATPSAPGSSVSAYLGCDPRRCRSRARDASPLTHLDESDPPMLIVNSTHELVPFDQARTMDAALAVAGVGHRLLLVRGGFHAEQLAPVATKPTLAFFRRELG
jgi:acetyl esterase/lipase